MTIESFNIISSLCSKIVDWSEWSACSVTCGRGVKYKQRRYVKEEGKYICHKKLTERGTCEASQKYCPQARKREQEDPICELGKFKTKSILVC